MKENSAERFGSISCLVLICLVFLPPFLECAGLAAQQNGEPIAILEQGSFFVVGGTVKVPGTFDPTQFHSWDAAGQSFPVDHLLTRYQISPNAREFPLVSDALVGLLERIELGLRSL